MNMVHQNIPSTKGMDSPTIVLRKPRERFALSKLTPMCEHQMPKSMAVTKLMRKFTAATIANPINGTAASKVTSACMQSMTKATTIIMIPTSLLIRDGFIFYWVEILCELILETVPVSAPGAACAPGTGAPSSGTSVDASSSCLAFLIARICDGSDVMIWSSV